MTKGPADFFFYQKFVEKFAKFLEILRYLLASLRFFCAETEFFSKDCTVYDRRVYKNCTLLGRTLLRNGSCVEDVSAVANFTPEMLLPDDPKHRTLPSSEFFQ